MSQGVECYSCLPKTAWPPNYLVNGSTALAPKYKPYQPNVNEELDRQKRERIRAAAEAKMERQARVIGVIIISLLVGVFLIGRYAAVYKMQKDITKVKTQIHNISMENEDLMVQLVKAGNIQQVEETAKSKLNMITPDKNKVIYMETTKDYFAKSANDGKKNKQEDFIAKVKSILF